MRGGHLQGTHLFEAVARHDLSRFAVKTRNAFPQTFGRNFFSSRLATRTSSTYVCTVGRAIGTVGKQIIVVVLIYPVQY